MPLTPGARAGAYEVIGLLGAGGMGEVYRARDTRLGRDVALKILPDAFAHDAERLARFQREAFVLASLNHPHIATIHGLEETDGRQALVMELVEGPTLADRIAQGPISVDEALPIACQIAEALEAAHEQGIIHRDLKPANIKLRSDGMVKVLDFGLAKALDPTSSVFDASLSPTITSPAMTQMGVILGTAAYMSPEQAKGKPAGKRSDMWAFGCVLYEMLTGRRAFEGDDVSDTLAAVLRAEPDWTALPQETPAAIRRLLRHCLTKHAKGRIGDASTARIEITEAQSGPETVEQPDQTFARGHVHVAWASALALLMLAAGGAIAWRLKPTPVRSVPLMRFTIPLPAGDRFTNTGVHAVALSDDGTRLVYTANGRLYLRRMDQLVATPIRGTEGADLEAGRSPFFSPDGQWIGFWQGGQIKKVSLNGGAPIVLCAAENPWGASWASDNTILYGQTEQGFGKGTAGIWRVSSEGGKPELVVKVEGGQVAHGPQMLPGGKAILFTLVTRQQNWGTAQIVVHSLDTGNRRVVLERGADARYVATGHLVYALAETVLGVPFDVTSLTVTGAAVPLVEDVANQNVVTQFAISSQGGLVYVPSEAVPSGQPQRQRTLVWVDRQGKETLINAPPRAYFHPRLSPDETRIALDVRDQERDIWIWHLAGETLTRLTLGPGVQQYGIWTADGRDVIFSSGEFGGQNSPRSLFRQPADGTGAPEQLTQSELPQFPSSVTPDGAAVVFREQTAPKFEANGKPVTTGMDILLLSLQGVRQPRPLLKAPFAESNAEVSPNGRWLAYQSDESGRDEIYVRPFPNVEGPKRLVSTNGGRQPLWGRNGRELFFESAGALMRVPVMTDAAFDAGPPTKLIAGPPPFGTPGRMYDVSKDGSRFLMIKPVAEAKADDTPPSARLVFVQNWLEDLKHLVRPEP